MTETDTDRLKVRLRYAIYGLLIISGLLIGGWLMPDVWLEGLKALFGGIASM